MDIGLLTICQHLVGSGCWGSVPNEQKGKCPVCNVKIQCQETVNVTRASVVVSAPANKKLTEDLTQLDVTSVMFYKDFRDHADHSEPNVSRN